MTIQEKNQPKQPQHREDYKIKELIERIEMKMSSNAIRETNQANVKN
jgi:hypothetical protein